MSLDQLKAFLGGCRKRRLGDCRLGNASIDASLISLLRQGAASPDPIRGGFAPDWGARRQGSLPTVRI